MSRTERQDRTLRARIVYYGPAGAGKTANLEALHGAAARHGHELLTINTRQDSTLLFDLLPIELESVLGRRVLLRLYTVPGHVRYDATRKVLLAGADAIVFVADSREARRDQNVWSLQNLRMNMRVAELDPERVPIVFQMNRRDAPDAARPVEVAEWLGLAEDRPIPAVAPRGEGVLPCLSEAALAALAGRAGEAGPDELRLGLERALAPLGDRLRLGPPRPAADDPPRTPIVLGHDDVLNGAIEVSMQLGEECAIASSRARRFSHEADRFRALSQALGAIGAVSDPTRVFSAAIDVAREAVGAEVVSLVTLRPQAPCVVEAAVGQAREPLASSSWGERLLARLGAPGAGPAVTDLDLERGTSKLPSDLRWLAGIPVGTQGRLLLVYGTRRSGSFDRHDLRLLGSLARYLAPATQHAGSVAAGARVAPPVGANVVGDRRVAREPRRAEDRLRERLLRGLSTEMREPLAAVAAATKALGPCESSADRARLVAEIAGSVDVMRRQLEDLKRVLDADGEAGLRLVDAQPKRLVQEAIRLAGCAHVQSEVQRFPGTARCDLPGLARAVATLIDSAAKSSTATTPVRVRLSRGRISTHGGDVAAFTISVFDRGPGAGRPDRGGRPTAVATECKEAAAAEVGLYEAHCLARRHGGTLERQSRKGGGSEFRLTVPLRPGADEASMEVRRG